MNTEKEFGKEPMPKLPQFFKPQVLSNENSGLSSSTSNSILGHDGYNASDHQEFFKRFPGKICKTLAEANAYLEGNDYALLFLEARKPYQLIVISKDKENYDRLDRMADYLYTLDVTISHVEQYRYWLPEKTFPKQQPDQYYEQIYQGYIYALAATESTIKFLVEGEKLGISSWTAKQKETMAGSQTILKQGVVLEQELRSQFSLEKFQQVNFWQKQFELFNKLELTGKGFGEQVNAIHSFMLKLGQRVFPEKLKYKYEEVDISLLEKEKSGSSHLTNNRDLSKLLFDFLSLFSEKIMLSIGAYNKEFISDEFDEDCKDFLVHFANQLEKNGSVDLLQCLTKTFALMPITDSIFSGLVNSFVRLKQKDMLPKKRYVEWDFRDSCNDGFQQSIIYKKDDGKLALRSFVTSAMAKKCLADINKKLISLFQKQKTEVQDVYQQQSEKLIYLAFATKRVIKQVNKPDIARLVMPFSQCHNNFLIYDSRENHKQSLLVLLSDHLRGHRNVEKLFELEETTVLHHLGFFNKSNYQSLITFSKLPQDTKQRLDNSLVSNKQLLSAYRGNGKDHLDENTFGEIIFIAIPLKTYLQAAIELNLNKYQALEQVAVEQQQFMGLLENELRTFKNQTLSSEGLQNKPPSP